MHKNNLVTLALVPLFAILTACGALAQQALPVGPAFPAAEYDALPKIGTATITGQGFMKTVGGDVKTAAGNLVILHPVTSYSLAVFDGDFVKYSDKPDQRVYTYMRKTLADGTGRFTFKNLPAGEYYVMTHVNWDVPGGGSLGLQGGNLQQRIKVADGESVEVILTR